MLRYQFSRDSNNNNNNNTNQIIQVNHANIIELNVGGTVFTTTFETLKKLEYFRNLLSPENEINLIKDKDNRIFPDRDPLIFQVILRNLRNKEFNENNFHLIIPTGCCTHFKCEEFNSERDEYDVKKQK